MFFRLFVLTLLTVFHLLVTTVSAGEVRVAVAANFQSPLKELARHFEQTTGHTILMSSGSSGKFYAQITHGAPFDLFFSADATRPKLLEQEALAVVGSRFTYAIGTLSLWSSDSAMFNNNGPIVLSEGHFDHLAIANPKTAPYGTAAQQVLVALGLWDRLKDRIVQGENIGQTFHFVYSKTAQLGFVATAQTLDPVLNGTGSRWDVPQHLYDPLLQQAVLLMYGRQNEAAKAFLDYVKGPEARTIIEGFGYRLE